jgi:hypothetical protein
MPESSGLIINYPSFISKKDPKDKMKANRGVAGAEGGISYSLL